MTTIAAYRDAKLSAVFSQALQCESDVYQQHGNFRGRLYLPSQSGGSAFNIHEYRKRLPDGATIYSVTNLLHGIFTQETTYTRSDGRSHTRFICHKYMDSRCISPNISWFPDSHFIICQTIATAYASGQYAYTDDPDHNEMLLDMYQGHRVDITRILHRWILKRQFKTLQVRNTFKHYRVSEDETPRDAYTHIVRCALDPSNLHIPSLINIIVGYVYNDNDPLCIHAQHCRLTDNELREWVERF
jgi:hypothetical protein